MKTTVERLDPAKVRLTVNVPAVEVDEAIAAAYKRIAKKVKIPGFRAGKAPKPMIDTHIGREAVIADAQDELLNESYGAALDAEGLRPLGQPEIGELDLMEAGKDFDFVAEVEVRPELMLSSTDGLSVNVSPAVATDHEIDAQIDATRDRFATLEPVEDRGVQADDFVLISFVGTVGGEAYDGNVVDRYLYEMNRGMMPEEFDQGLVGLSAGDETTVTFDIPEGSSNPDFVNKVAQFEITVHEIKAKVLPEIDDDFASNVGGFDSVEDMRNSVREQMDRTRALGHSREVEQAVRAALAMRLEGDVPEVMVESAKGQMLRDFVNGLESRDTSIQDYLRATGGTMELLESGIGEQAAQSVREELALESLFRHLGSEITDADLDAEIRMLASDASADPSELRRKWEESGVISVLKEQITHRKAIEWLMTDGNVEINEVLPESELPAAGTKTKKPAKSKKADKPAKDTTEE
ncbi:MAG: trigger factor [Coriobacteriia bacterium]|nr:trigger factor [Coriobacteriia bacterium]